MVLIKYPVSNLPARLPHRLNNTVLADPLFIALLLGAKAKRLHDDDTLDRCRSLNFKRSSFAVEPLWETIPGPERNIQVEAFPTLSFNQSEELLVHLFEPVPQYKCTP